MQESEISSRIHHVVGAVGILRTMVLLFIVKNYLFIYEHGKDWKGSIWKSCEISQA